MRDRMDSAAAAEHALIRRVTARLRGRCRVQAGDRLLVAVSGGADSLARLHILAEIAPAARIDLVVAHFDHALRPESAGEALQVAEHAQALALEHRTERWPSPQPGEAAAREARYDFLERAAHTAGCTIIATAHHLDDQVETGILRLGRGTGLRGISGMAWRRTTRGHVPIIRPLLDTPRAALRDYCAARGLLWIEDPTNSARDRARNRVRHDVLPALASSLPQHWMQRWSRSMDDLRAVWQHIDNEGAALLRNASVASDVCDVARLSAAPDPVLRAALMRWLAPAHPQRAHVDAAVQLVRRGHSGRVLALPGGHRLARDQTTLALLAPEEPTAARASQRSGSLHIQPVALADAQNAIATTPVPAAASGLPGVATAHLAANTLQPPFELRTPRPGDRVQLLGAPGHRTLARVFQDRRIPLRERATWPVVADAAGIIWLPGIGVAERARIVPGTSVALRASYRHAPGGAGPAEEPRGLPEAPRRP